jgi:adenylate cyclase
MFLDMKSSTTIAENIGHKAYFELIKNYYADMTNAILETSGDIYQYVGYEIVVSWLEKDGLYKNNCIRCFQKIDTEFKRREAYYLKTFGVAPDFKAGFHIGEVTTGEIGIIKKDVIYTGDVLNTAARIQGQCNNYNSRILISEDIKHKLLDDSSFLLTNIGKLTLKGKMKAIELFSVS